MLKNILEIVNQKRLSGDDLFLLLENIMIYGSISRAASKACVSYRYAWGLLQEAEKIFGLTLADKHVGGYAGGGALLTADGKRLLNEYKEYKQMTGRQLENFISKIGLTQPDSASTEKKVNKLHSFLLLASTLEPVEAGLMDELENAFFTAKKILVRHLAAGSGKALEIAREGRVDMVLTHAPELEEQFMAEGWGVKQLPIMSSNFILVGDVADPGKLRQQASPLTVLKAFRQIALSRSPFVTRGDHSGTHLREVEIWEKCGLTPGEEWYHFYPGVAGNLGALRFAREKKAYMLTDAASFYLSRADSEMAIYIGSEQMPAPELANTFVLTLVNPEKVPFSRLDEASLFARWLQEEEGSRIIADFGRDIYNQPLFVPPGLRF